MPGRLAEHWRGLALASIAIALSVGHADRVWAQAPGAMSLNDLVVAWIQGNYATPLFCKIDGEAQRGLRRILIETRPSKSPPREALVRFVDLEAEEATRCFTEIGGSSPNITGELVVRHPTIKPRDTAMRDFKAELRRKRGYDLEIISGRLLVSEVGVEAKAPESLDFRGGQMRVRLLRPGSDGVRLLESLPSPRKVTLEFETRTGRVFSFPASLARPREPGGMPGP
ncbi:MAG: hypothetical protein JRG89_21465 [Deltaproteobacteria bacterium]|nr:hypothetical protein [Deltaproteobacteria bacterium]MBW2390980.1 hypothetical protein [Deltaproteobacteria bacterium]